MWKRELLYSDFEATIRIFSQKEGGRATPAYNGILWDFAYAEGDPIKDGLFMIYPDFYEAAGTALEPKEPLPIGLELSARMMVFNDECREQFHWHRISPGVRFYCHEGGRRVAEGIVTKITGLFEP